MKGFSSAPMHYVGLGFAPDADINAHELFGAMIEDVLHDGNVDLAMQKAFRWGFQDGQGDTIPGLRDLTQRLREDRQELLDQANDVDRADIDGDAMLVESDEEPDPSMDIVQVASRLEEMERSLRAVEKLDDLQGLDPDLMETVLTNQERSWLDQWANMQGMLESEGLVLEVGERLELSPLAVRRIGEYALRAIFSTVREGHGGDHETRARGRLGVPVETSAPWQFGDSFSLNLSRTIMNSITREGPRANIRLLPEDFEVFERESRGSTATVLLIDMSRSMFYNGCWDAAKRAALALDTLMRGQFQRDDLEIAGFSERADRLTLTQLPALEWNEYSHGTNLEDGLRLARELLRRYKGKSRQIVLITDGEPTAYMEGGEARFEHPPTTQVFDATMREVMRCTRENVTINTFLLERADAMVEFAEAYSRVNRGRLIYVDPAHLGRYLVRDFLQNRSTHLG